MSQRDWFFYYNYGPESTDPKQAALANTECRRGFKGLAIHKIFLKTYETLAEEQHKKLSGNISSWKRKNPRVEILP